MQKIFKIERLDTSDKYKKMMMRDNKGGRKTRCQIREMSIIKQMEKKEINRLIEKQVLLHNEEKQLLEEQEQNNQTKYNMYIEEPRGKFNSHFLLNFLA
jgi:hypothetical protein